MPRSVRAGTGPASGATVVRWTSNESEYVWECIVTGGREWHCIRVLGWGFGLFPLHIDRSRNVSD